MKNNKKTYFLLGVVAIIWGLIAYQIISSMSTDKVATPQQKLDVSFNPKPIKEQDTFSISINNRDPFLGTIERPKVKKPKPIKKQPVEIEIPISYSGLVVDQNTKEKIFFVHINNNQHLMNINDVVDEVKLLKGNENEITITYKKQKKNIKRN